MKLVTYAHKQNPRETKIGAMLKDCIVDLECASTWAQGAAGIPHEDAPFDAMLNFIYAGSSAWEYAKHIVAAVAQAEKIESLKGAGHKPIAFEQNNILLYPPIPRPLVMRDFYAFENHVKTASANRGREVPKEWYEFPVFYYNNPNTIYGHDMRVPCPPYTQALDYELEIAAVIGKAGIDLGAEDAAHHIFGFTIFNDWSARDIQRKEMAAGLGPAKGKDFASSLGPCIVTADEIADRATGRPGVYDLVMQARVNGATVSQGNFKDIHWSFGEMIARASQSAQIIPGEVMGSGTVGTGCLLEITKGQGPWLNKGDVIELEIERIGVLKNIVA
jgi:fumarylacetoacetate (FAA) hydrolase